MRKMTLVVIALAMMALTGRVALATPGDQVCGPLDSGKIDTTGDPLTVTVTAPPGYLIDGYCVKAGSVKQGDGPVYVDVDPPVAELTFGYPSGKAVSHYSVGWTMSLPTPTVTFTPTPTPTETTTPTPTVTPSPPSCGGGPCESPPAGCAPNCKHGGGGGGEDPSPDITGDLPVTGASDVIGPVIAGGILLAIGLGTLFLGRRRYR